MNHKTTFKVFATAVLTISVHYTQAQVKLGVSGGMTSAAFDYEEKVNQADYSSSDKVGFNGGIKMIVGKGMIKFVPELFFNQNGTKDEYYTSFTSFSNDFLKNKVALD